MTSLRYPIVLFDAGDTLIGPRESFGAVYARVLATVGVDATAEALEAGLRACWAEINGRLTPGCDRYGEQPGGEESYWLRFVEGTLAQTKGVGPNPELARRALRPLRNAFLDPSVWRVFDDVVPALAELREIGAKLGVVSNWDSRLPELLRVLGLSAYFDTVVVSHIEGIEKPSPELFLRAVSRLGGTPSQAIHVGDIPELDERGARAAGIHSVLIDRRGRLAPAFGAVSDLSTIPGVARTGSSSSPES
jgi:putative hydrolase of the HAD superfamily